MKNSIDIHTEMQDEGYEGEEENITNNNIKTNEHLLTYKILENTMHFINAIIIKKIYIMIIMTFKQIRNSYIQK